MKTVKPASNYIFAKPDEATTKTSSGILLSEAASFKPHTAEIINIGGEVKDFKPKDKIVYKSYSATDIKLNDDDYIIIAEEDVIGKVVEF